MKRIAASIAMALGLIGGAQAATVTYDFTVTNPFSGSPATVAGVFSYDDTATATTRPSSNIGSTATYYQASGMSLGGAVGTNSYLAIQNNVTSFGGTVDLAAFQSTFSGTTYALILILQSTTFSSAAANQMNGLKFSDLVVTTVPFLGTASNFAQYTGPYLDPLSALSQRPADVPVPATLALLGLGLAGLGAARRKSATAPR
jgi:hypothetical protein